MPLPSNSLFPKVALLLIGALVATALLAVVLAGTFARESNRDLLESTLVLRLDAVAEEVEERADIGPLGEVEIPDRLARDLATRFPDPLAFIDEGGEVAETYGGRPSPDVPEDALAALDEGRIAVQLGPDSWGLAPILAPDGLPAGALLVRPFRETVREESVASRRGLRNALVAVSVLAAVIALALGALLTWRLVRPIQKMTRRVEALGEGDYAARLPETRDDELGRLAAAINEMAGRVEASVETLREADRVRRELVGNVGHDLRTPLAALGGYLEEAERLAGEGRGDEAAQAVENARRQQAHIASLVADLFELSVLERPASQVPLRLGPVPIGELIRDLAATHAPTFREPRISLDVDVPQGLPTLHADGARLFRAISNLLDNALRHSPEGGTVRLGARAEAVTVTVSVEDEGPGIAPGDLEQIFERYYRGEGARTRGAQGTGLGLAIARAVARAHGGDLVVETGTGPGSLFRLRLPLPSEAHTVLGVSNESAPSV
ncbi:MAG: HAMP domain-containing sensor histidine kinase [Bacteroidota bacterium]